MPDDFDADLTTLAAEIFRDEVSVYDQGDAERWISMSPVIAGWSEGLIGDARTTGAFVTATGGFPAVTEALIAVTRASSAVDSPPEAAVTFKKVFRLPDRLPGVRLPAGAELAHVARSAQMLTRLEALVRWVGQRGRLVTATDDLSLMDATQAATSVRVPYHYFPYLWEYALASGWIELCQPTDGRPTVAKAGPTAWRWADGDDTGALHVWAVTFAAVLATTFEVAAAARPQAVRDLRFQGSGVVTAMMLFLGRRTGLTVAEVGDLIKDEVIGRRPRSRARKAWDGWVAEHGHPAHWLLSELADLRAVTAPDGGHEALGLTPIAQWALRVQLRMDGIEIPLLRAVATTEMSAASMVALSEAVTEAQFDLEFAEWLAIRGRDRGTRDLLVFAAFSDSQSRLAAVNLVRRIGSSARDAWRDAMERPELRGYARMALSRSTDDLHKHPDDFTWVATDMLAMACGQENPDPEQIAALFGDAVPAGAETWILGLMSQSAHPDVARVLTMLGEYHPERRVARAARKAARLRRKNQRGSPLVPMPAAAGIGTYPGRP
jgi:hypothetical protein